MEIQMTQLELNLFLNILQDYLREQSEPLTRLSSQIAALDTQGSPSHF